MDDTPREKTTSAMPHLPFHRRVLRAATVCCLGLSVASSQALAGRRILTSSAPTGGISDSASAPKVAAMWGPPFPRLSHTTWGGAVVDWYSRFDLIDNNANNNPDFGRSIKAANPNALVVVTRDFNAGLSHNLMDKEAWKVKSSQGQVCRLYFESDAYFNYTDLAPAIPTEYGTVRYNEYIAHWMTDPKNIDLTIFDGVMTDGFWDSFYGGPPCDSDIDLDQNGKNDYQEAGKGSSWVEAQIHAGAIKVLALLRAKLDALRPGLLLIVNSGGPHDWGKEYTNGFLHEHFNGAYGFDWVKDQYDSWIANGARPPVPILTSDTAGGTTASPERNDFQLMRYGLSIALLTGAYYDFTEYGRAGEHYWVKYYDEYDTNLGYPTGAAQKTASGAWVRFFDNGLVLVNGSDTDTVTVTVDQVRTLAGYNPGSNGVYWRFLGGQDLAVNGNRAVNNGDPFDQAHPITLNMRQPMHWDEQGNIHPTIADGIVLLREPTTVVSDILIDNWNSGTSPASLSPGSDEARTMVGFAQADDCDAGSEYYTVRCAIYLDGNGNPEDIYHSPPFATAGGGSQATATYTPHIGIAGAYEVFEWHGKLREGQAATNTSVSIVHAGGTEQRRINQTTSTGKWNSLGIYTFAIGATGRVTLSAWDANGTVIADAVKFVYQGTDPGATFIDVPKAHWAYGAIEALYQGGYVTGCSTSPRRFCPDDFMIRAESAVFVVRGVHGGSFTPPQPTSVPFADVPLGEWFSKWAKQLWDDGYTAGCGVAPLIFCPSRSHTRAEGAVFFVRMKNGRDYQPPAPSQSHYTDVALSAWYADWVEAAYQAGMVQECEAPEKRGDAYFRPEEGLTRAEAACMMVKAKGLPQP
ncbi:MAG TPA: putative glycoside hydrolase [Anaerolineales bacterium]|nr:putative glycoside hydrolase [Anaerolineales bacterium]